MALYTAKNTGRNKVCLYKEVKNEGESNVKSII